MPIQYRRPGEARHERVPILTYPPDRIVRFLGGPEHSIQVYVHYLQRYSVPCLGDECELCYAPPVLCGYAPVVELVVMPTKKGFYRKAILFVTQDQIHLLEKDYQGHHYRIGRTCERSNAPLQFACDSKAYGDVCKPFDIQSRLEALWSTRSRTALVIPKVDRGDEPEEAPLKFGKVASA